MDLPMICACDNETVPLRLYNKDGDNPYPFVEVNEDCELTCHNLEFQQLPTQGEFALEDDVLIFGNEAQRVPIGRFSHELRDRLDTWCQWANALLQPAPTAA